MAIIKKYEEQLIYDFNLRNLFDIVYEHHDVEYRSRMVTNVLKHQ